MHTQHTLHLTDKQYKLAVALLTFTAMDVSDSALVETMTAEGIRQYPAEKLVEQRARFYNEAPVINAADPLYGCLASLVEQQAA